MPTSAPPLPRSLLTRRIFGDLAHAVWRYRGQTVAALLLMIVARLATVLMPLTLKHIVDELGHPLEHALFPVFLVLAYALLRFFGDALNEARDVVFSVVVQRTVAALTERTFAHLHKLSARFHAGRETGAIVRDVQKGADGIGFLLGTALFTIVPTVFEIAVIVGIMVHNYAREFMLAIALTCAVYAVYTYVFTRRRVAFQRAVNQLEAQSDGRLVDSLLNYDTVKYFATEESETGRLGDVLEKWVHARIANQKALTALHVGQSAVIALGVAAVMLLAAQHVTAGTMSVGDLILVNAYLIQICMPLNTLGFVFRETNDALVNVERMFVILAARGRTGEDIDARDAKPLKVTQGRIEFEHVDFGYDAARRVLRDVNFQVHPGNTLAVVGGSGSGKSTLVKLLFRLYRPDHGAIRIDGQDLATVTQRSLREAIGIVPQDTVLFNETIAYNIAYGRPSATRADVVRAARAAQLDEFIERLPDHYDTRVGERGVRLSGGERQRIAIARAILKDPRIIVFDEATSALDTRSERAIQTELTRLAEGRTTIVIAHRLSTVVDADWILVMEHGQLVEQGMHRELLAREGVYAKMWSLQWQQGELEHAQRRLTSQSVSVSALTAGAIDALHDEITARGVALVAEPADNELRVTGDPSVLQPLIAELCRNEIEQASAGQRIALRAQRHSNHVWVSVHGMGERPAELSLVAARQMERALAAAGGSFSLMPLQGRLAYVAMLPLRTVADVGPPAPHAAAPGAPLDGLFVMAIDDQEEARDALEAVLSMSGARVALFASGTEALAWLRDHDAAQWPQVLLCDIMLADEDGYQVLRALRELEAARPLLVGGHLPAIAVTGYTEAVDPRRSQSAGFDAHLHKPVPPDELIATIRRLAAGDSGETESHESRQER
ncbi:ATP-binding cassette domain-containing protein [Paraburkholderia sp. MMS20-SJTR3]|uniref:ATP-binding cassette domain-containing protein n=1 Tax=Paraburkholderia sejongensis TaxID=2886946 RepID=A0ABS8K071_9BURK|nr:ATP-binding cassette domain-containing protein [Paraburkholderia sp. MMS20-SJTR3]MCC8395478.1 ATP-binding cassette domain-containing protein [Paraburkholderia sp. MMS20-SJTR3]